MVTFEAYIYHLTQLRAVKTVMEDYTSFRPDDETVAMVGTRISNGETALTNAEDALAEMNLARGERIEKATAGHDAAVDVYAIMKKRYRKDASSMNAIELLPVQDDTPAETLRRMSATSRLWGKLPNPPGSATPFKAYDIMGKVEFDALLAALKTAIEEEPKAEEEFDRVNGILKAMEADITDFVGAALVQGRNQYAEGTAERAAVDSIPTEDSTPVPSQAQVSLVEMVGTDGMSITYDAAHATTFDILLQSPGSPVFVTVVADRVEKAYTLTGLVAGNYVVKVVGKNSRGPGDESDGAGFTIP